MKFESPLDNANIAFEDRRLLDLLYNQSHRKYHNAPHPAHVRAYCERIRFLYANLLDKLPGSKAFNGIGLGLFYDQVSAWHDAIYEIGKTDNEELSAQLFASSATAEALPQQIATDVAAAIRASANHWNPINEALPTHVKVFLDADLFELSTHYEIFHQNALNILAEYSSKFSYEECVKGREDWYRSILAKDRIFWICRDRDDLVRTNIKRALKEVCHCTA
ncbi:hypothetical protein D3C87_637050 [compost metagenome]